LSLIEEKGYQRVTVQDILDRADVGRSTFYAHYRDKDDLLLSGFQDIRSALAGESEGAKNPARQVEFLDPLLTVFKHVEGHRHRWQPLTQKGGADLVIRILRESITDLVQEHFRSQFSGAKGKERQLEAAMQYVVGACMGLLIWWLDNEDVTYSADEIYSIFRRLTTEGARRLLAD
jgi:AcrR family transcriptional regulator